MSSCGACGYEIAYRCCGGLSRCYKRASSLAVPQAQRKSAVPRIRRPQAASRCVAAPPQFQHRVAGRRSLMIVHQRTLALGEYTTATRSQTARCSYNICTYLIKTWCFQLPTPNNNTQHSIPDTPQPHIVSNAASDTHHRPQRCTTGPTAPLLEAAWSHLQG